MGMDVVWPSSGETICRGVQAGAGCWSTSRMKRVSSQKHGLASGEEGVLACRVGQGSMSRAKGRCLA